MQRVNAWMHTVSIFCEEHLLPIVSGSLPVFAVALLLLFSAVCYKARKNEKISWPIYLMIAVWVIFIILIVLETFFHHSAETLYMGVL